MQIAFTMLGISSHFCCFCFIDDANRFLTYNEATRTYRQNTGSTASEETGTWKA